MYSDKIKKKTTVYCRGIKTADDIVFFIVFYENYRYYYYTYILRRMHNEQTR